MLVQPLRNLKLDLEIINPLWKQTKKTCEVAIHFNRTPHVLSDFTFQCIDQIQTSTSGNTENLLITKEAYWSAQLFPLSPFGLNKRQEFHSKNRIHYTWF